MKPYLGIAAMILTAGVVLWALLALYGPTFDAVDTNSKDAEITGFNITSP